MPKYKDLQVHQQKKIALTLNEQAFYGREDTLPVIENLLYKSNPIAYKNSHSNETEVHYPDILAYVLRTLDLKKHGSKAEIEGLTETMAVVAEFNR